MTMSLEERFWSKVDRRGEEECWPWRASTTWNNYGQFVVNSRTVRAHRFSWELSTGVPVPDGMNVIHKCGNPKCVNPHHLGLSDDADSFGDRVERVGQPKGSMNSLAKLTEEDIPTIRSMSANGMTLQSIASHFGVSHTTIHKVLVGKTWSHINWEDIIVSKSYGPEFISYEHLMLTEFEEYNISSLKWERRVDYKLRNLDTDYFGGNGLTMKVRDGSLSVEYQRSHTNSKVLLLNRGVHKIKTIVIASQHGYITLDAITWLCQQGITVYLLDWRGNFLQTLTPRQNRDARLVYLQYRAIEKGLDTEIAREIIRSKAHGQLEVLRRLPEHRLTQDSVFKDMYIFSSKGNRTDSSSLEEHFSEAMARLDRAIDVDAVRLVEARLAITYWHCIMGLPIHWKRRDREHVPEHWHGISERISAISTNNNASRATNPFHSILNFAYALLEAQVTESINVAGLAPEVGFLHVQEDSGNLLAYDLMECFRPAVDTLVLALFRDTTFGKGDLIQWYSGECRLNEELRRYVLAECRIDSKAIDIQCRWLRNLLKSQL